MICRLWRGWTTPAVAPAYEGLVRGEIIPGIEALNIAGFEHIDLLRRDLDQEVEFATMMWFRDMHAIKAFAGKDYSLSYVPAAARAILLRYDNRVAHFDVRDRRPQPL